MTFVESGSYRPNVAYVGWEWADSNSLTRKTYAWEVTVNGICWHVDVSTAEIPLRRYSNWLEYMEQNIYNTFLVFDPMAAPGYPLTIAQTLKDLAHAYPG